MADEIPTRILSRGLSFFTVVSERRRPLLASVEAVAVLRSAIRTVRATRPFEVDAMVVLPDCAGEGVKESIVITKLGNKQTILLNFVDQAMFIVNSARPVSGEPVFQRFRFSDPLIGPALNVTN